MKKLLLALGIVALVCSPAFAGRNANGAMLLHADNTVVFSAGTDYCGNFPLPPTCDGLNTVANNPAVDTMIWMVAAFSTSSSPGVNAYQVGLAGDVTNAYMDGWLVCGPSPLEIPDTGWPGAGTGDAVAYTSTVNSQLFKMYWFACGAPGAGSTLSTTNYYGSDHHAEWADDSNPPVIDFCNLFGTVQWGGPGSKECPPNQVTGACCFTDGTCRDLLQADCGAAGGTYEGDGTACASFQCPQPPTGACCFADGSCQVLTELACTAAGGTQWTVGGTCNPNICPQPVHACCFADGSCQNLTSDACAQQGGVYHADQTCETFTCPPPVTGACCNGDVCTIQTEANCTAGGGQYKGDGTTCEPNNPCVVVPTRPSTWGQIKGSYR